LKLIRNGINKRTSSKLFQRKMCKSDYTYTAWKTIHVRLDLWTRDCWVFFSRFRDTIILY